MKKFFTTLFAVLYLGVSSGAILQFHYCTGQLTDWGLSVDRAEKCNSCGMNKTQTKDCCKDQHQKFKVEESQKAFQKVYHFNLPALVIPFIAFNEGKVSFIKENLPFNNAHLRTQNIPVFVRNCNFRI